MKTKTLFSKHRAVRSSGFGKIIGLLLGAWLLPFTPLKAAVLYLQADQGTENWNTVTGAAGWFTAPTGGSHPGAMNSLDTYDTQGKLVRSGTLATSTFAGGTLILNGYAMVLNSGTAIVGNLLVSADATIHNGGFSSINNLTLNVGVLQMDASLALNSPVSQSRVLTFNVTTLQGSGEIRFGYDNKANTVLFSAANATAYTGNLVLRDPGSSLTIVGDLSTAGGLNLWSGTALTMNSNLTFSSLTIGGSSLGAGVYSYAWLNANYDSYFANGGSGSITVIPEPASGWLVLGGVGGLWLFRRKLRK